MISAADSCQNNIRIDRTERFRDTVKKYVKQLQQIRDVSMYLQKQGLSLSDRRLALDSLVEVIHEQRKTRDHDFSGYMMKSNYLSQPFLVHSDRDFLTGVTKIQKLDHAVLVYGVARSINLMSTMRLKL